MNYIYNFVTILCICTNLGQDRLVKYLKINFERWFPIWSKDQRLITNINVGTMLQIFWFSLPISLLGPGLGCLGLGRPCGRGGGCWGRGVGSRQPSCCSQPCAETLLMLISGQRRVYNYLLQWAVELWVLPGHRIQSNPLKKSSLYFKWVALVQWPVTVWISQKHRDFRRFEWNIFALTTSKK